MLYKKLYSFYCTDLKIMQMMTIAETATSRKIVWKT